MQTGPLAIFLGLAFTGCVIVAAPPPDATPTDSPATASPDPRPPATSTASASATPTAAPTAAPIATSQPSTTGQTCGSRGLAPCPATHFCDFPGGSQCGATDGGGTCKPITQVCTREFKPVCGCDGQTYATACVANSKGMSVSREGKCN